MIFGSFVGAVSMRSGSPMLGNPEATLMIFATAQVGLDKAMPAFVVRRKEELIDKIRDE